MEFSESVHRKFAKKDPILLQIFFTYNRSKCEKNVNMLKHVLCLSCKFVFCLEFPKVSISWVNTYHKIQAVHLNHFGNHRHHHKEKSLEHSPFQMIHYQMKNTQTLMIHTDFQFGLWFHDPVQMDTLHHHQTLNNKKNHIDEFKSVA
jgi:hypothetical protein